MENEEVAQSVMCLLTKREDLTLISRTHIKEPLGWYSFVISALERWRQEGEWDSLTTQTTVYLASSRSQEETLTQKEMGVVSKK